MRDPQLRFRLIHLDTRRMGTVTKGDGRQCERAETGFACVGMAGVEMRLDLEIPVMGMPGAPKDRLGGEDGNCHHLTPLCWAVARPACFYLYLNLVPHLSARHPPLHTLSVILFFSVSFCLNLIISLVPFPIPPVSIF